MKSTCVLAFCHWTATLLAMLFLSACGGTATSTPTPIAAPAESRISVLAGSLQSAGAADGMGTGAQFAGPERVALDSAGNVYVADTASHTIRKLAPDGLVTTLAGLAGSSGGRDGLGTAARFSSPRGIAVDAMGTLYVADAGNHTIRKIDPSGQVTTWVGAAGQAGNADGVGPMARLFSPTGLGFDLTGNLYVTDQNRTVRKISPDGLVRTFLGPADLGISWWNGQPVGLSGVAVDASGRVYVADRSSDTVRRFTNSAEPSPWGGSGDGFIHVRFASDLAVDEAGVVFVASGGFVPIPDTGGRYASSIERIGADGVVQRIAGGDEMGFADAKGLAARFRIPTGIAVNRQGVVFIADVGNYAVRKMTPDYGVSTMAGGTSAGYVDGTGGKALFQGPKGIVAADSGMLFVADGNSVIRKVDPTGTVSTLAFSASDASNATQFDGVIGAMSMDQSGAVYLYTYPTTFVSKSLLHTIDPQGQLKSVRVSPGITAMAFNRLRGDLYVANNSGEVSRMAPDGSAQVLASGFGAVRAMVFDSAGTLYVADWQNCTISTVAATGSVKRVTGKMGNCTYQDGPELVARLAHPGSLAADDKRNIYMGDDSFTIRKMAPDGTVTTVAGVAGTYGIQIGDLPGVLGKIQGLAWWNDAIYATVENAIIKVVLTSGKRTP